jgi:hypothetical protein
VARTYNLGLATPDAWVTQALVFEKHGWDLGAVDAQPQLLASFDRARVVEAAHRCAKEGVVSIVGDERTAREALAKAWP